MRLKITSIVLLYSIIFSLYPGVISYAENNTSAEYTIQRDDASWYNGNGELKLSQYFDKVVLEPTNDKYVRINSLIQQESDNFLADADEQITFTKENPSPYDGWYSNYSDAVVTTNSNGILSIKTSYVWFMGGTVGYGDAGLNFNLNTGNVLSLTDVFAMNENEIEQYFKEQTKKYIADNPDKGWWNDTVQNAVSTVEAYTLEQFNYYIENNNIYLCYPKYELGPGAMGPITVCCPVTKPKKNITIVLNGKELSFDQPPIMAEDRILVPIRKIAEAMGDTVLWNDEYQTAFIKHEDRGLIIKLLEDHIKIVENEQWTQWEEKELDVMAFSLNGRTLVPVRAFCESLGADVNWNGAEYTAYITYDFNKETKKMRSEMFKNINTVYYALNNDDVPFNAYSDDLNFFYNNRNRQKDAIKMGVSDIWAGVNDLLSGLSNSENIMKNSFEQMLAVIPDNSIVSVDKELLDDLKEFADRGKYIFDEINGIDDEFLELHPKLKALDTSIEAVGRAYDIMSFSTEQIAIFLSNYETNISYIEQLRSILQENNLLDGSLNTSLIVLQQEYSDKFFSVMLNTRDELEKFTITEGTNLATGGLFSVGVFTWEQIFKLSGITDDGQALKTFYGLYCINGFLDIAYDQTKDKIIKGDYTPSDVEDLKVLDDLQRALKIKNYQCIETISQDSDTHSMCDEYIAQLSKSCILWKTE